MRDSSKEALLNRLEHNFVYASVIDCQLQFLLGRMLFPCNLCLHDPADRLFGKCINSARPWLWRNDFATSIIFETAVENRDGHKPRGPYRETGKCGVGLEDILYVDADG